MSSQYLDTRTHLGFIQVFHNAQVLEHLINALIDQTEAKAIHGLTLVERSMDYGKKTQDVLPFVNYRGYVNTDDPACAAVINASYPSWDHPQAFQAASMPFFRTSFAIGAAANHTILLYYGTHDDEPDHKQLILESEHFVNIYNWTHMGMGASAGDADGEGENKETVIPDQVAYVLELGLFNKDWDECFLARDKWMYCLKHLPALSLTPETVEDPGLKALLTHARITTLS